MNNMNTPIRPPISIALVQALVKAQFPQWSHLPIEPVACSGWDNRTFHLGTNMSVRLPSAEGYASQPEKEYTWLPQLAPYLSMPISQPLALGKPSQEYPWNWSIHQWIEGESANSLLLSENQLETMALPLAEFLNELHTIPTKNGPTAGLHNYYRGAHPSVYDAEARSTITQLHHCIDKKAVMQLWEKAIDSQWENPPVWVHGDFSRGNILMKEEKVTAVIDFGCMGIGDPACDLVLAWTLFNYKSRSIFQSTLPLDENTWHRARGWALWKACLELKKCQDTESKEAIAQRHIINELLHG